ncbi:hypothetical protein SteCoe_7283 [Stentor coeruleus]|uniref:Uncharacterized protein n=1 Tax=Stentor coeruleus TaxID=5963 RepID=A0A1R2CMX7_9CILI|nr:hypothetical protein SteCoe_7283 [Stentor coeruleus]
MFKYVKRIGKKLQNVTFCPLLLGIAICTIITLAMLYSRLITLVNDMQDILELREKVHIKIITQVRSQRISSLISNNKHNLKYLKALYEGIKSGIIIPSNNLTESYSVNVYDYINNDYEYTDPIIWLYPDEKADISDFPEYEYMKLYFIFLKNLNKGSSKQFGIIFSNGLEIRYPAINMSYIQHAKPCSEYQDYDSRCLIAYKNDTALISENFSLYYQYNLSLMLRDTDHTTVAYLPDSYFVIKQYDEDNYINIITDSTGSRTYLDSNKLIPEMFNYNVTLLLLTKGLEIEEGLSYNIIKEFQINDNQVIPIRGFNIEYIGTHTEVKIDSQNYSSSLLSLTLVNKNIALKDFRIFLDGIYNTIVIQVSVFLIFMTLGIFATCWLSISITNRVTNPLCTIEAYLRGSIPRMPKLEKNKEVNEIDKHLLKIEVIEQMIDPRFILHPNPSQRLENLKQIDSLFQNIKNNKGLAITKNLIGNIYLDNEEFEKAIELYKEALGEIDTLFHEIVAQEHAENKLTFEEKRYIKFRSGKETQGWDTEKSTLLSNMTERILQLCYAKIISLEYSLDSAYELRGEWKFILELQTKALQYYITSSNDYINMLKVLIDMAYVYHKLQYFHTALELLDIIYEELIKLNTEYTEQAKTNSKGCTVDIDITRLKRISVKVKDSNGRKLYFHVGGITFEKDILKQIVMYRRALIYYENERYHEAALYFTMTIEQGIWYDPEIRKLAIEKIYAIYCKFKILHDEPLLISLYDKGQMKKKSIIFCLCYDILNETSINEAVVSFVSEEIQSQNENFGAITAEIDSKFCMEVVERDYPGLDIENLISSVIYSGCTGHINDVVFTALKKLPNYTSEAIIVVISKNLHNNIGPTRIEDISEKLENTKLALITLDDVVPDDFLEMIFKNGLTLISRTSNVKQAFEELRTGLTLISRTSNVKQAFEELRKKHFQ